MPIHRANILLIEDHPGDVTLIREYLLKADPHGFDLSVASSLAQGLAFIRQRTFDVILSDLGLPDSKGFQTVERLLKACSKEPVVVLTGNGDEGLGRSAVAVGAQDFLDKNELNSQVLGRAIAYAIERKQLFRRLEMAHEIARMGNWQINVEDERMIISQQVYHLLGVSNGQEFSRWEDYLDRVMEEDRGRVEKFMKEVRRHSGEYELDHRILGPDGNERHLVLKCQSELNGRGQLVSLFGTIQEITDRKKMEELLREKELNERSAHLRQEFLAKTSHEIRTPLNPILLLTQLLLDTDLSPKQREYLNGIRSGGETLLAVVNDLLDLSKIEAGKIDFNPKIFSIGKVFDSVLELMEINAREKGLNLQMGLDSQIPNKVYGDPVRLTQIILNLVGNAIKFTNSGKVRVSARLMSKRSRSVKVEFVVEDTGIGIPEDKLQLIFDSFQQLESAANRQYGGTGLGLTIVRQLVILQGGSIDVSSEVGSGSRFVFDLEFGMDKEDEIPPDVEAPAPQIQLEGARILLVEDNPLNQMVTKQLLIGWGCSLKIAHNGREGVEILEQADFDLVLMDVQMPEMDGYQATRYIRQNLPEPMCYIPIIALTANAFTGSDDECLQAGMDDYVSKPISIQTLNSKIEYHLNHSGKRTREGERKEKGPDDSDPEDPTDHLLPSSNTPKPFESEQMAMSNYVDLTYLEEVCAGDKGIITKIIQQYLKTSPDMLGKMESQFEQGNSTDLAATAHKLKSNIQVLKIDPINDTIIRIEGLAKQGVITDQLKQLLEELRVGIEASIVELNQILKEL